jgi:uncharacterized caspase-like protein
MDARLGRIPVDLGNKMRNFVRLSLFWLMACMVLALAPRSSAAAEQRFALVIGNSQYKTGTLATPANDAGLVADALQAAGFTVTGARDLDQATLRESFREFIGQVSAAGPDAVALVYLAGYGVQYAGDNYFVPVDADIAHDVDVPLQAIRISDFTQPLTSLPGRVKIVILDAARQNGFAQGAQPLAGGLALVDPAPSLAIAFNAAPGTVAPDEQGPYGAYATALTEMIGTGGLSLDDIFTRVRLRVSEETQGAEVPWYAAQIDGPFFMTERTADAPPPPNAEPVAQYRTRPMRDFGNPDDAYGAALALDTIDGYEQFLAIYPNSPYAPRIATMIAVRREEIAWRHCVMNDTPPAYWSYLRRYPDGPHAWDARRRLEFLRAELVPPPDFAMIDFGVPPPPPYELGYIDRPFIMFGGLGFAPPPRPPVLFLPPRPREFAALPPPPPSRERFALPIPAAAPVAAFVRPPLTVVVRQPPPGAPAGPGGRPEVRVSLPAAAARAATGAPAAPGTPGTHPGFGTPATLTPGAPGTPPLHPGAGAPLPHPGAGAPPPPASALAKPETPPPHPAGAAPMIEKPPAPGTPPHPGANAPRQVFEKPAPPPPHPAGPTPAFAKPTPPPPPPHPSVSAPAIEKPVTPPHPAPAMVRPSAPPPHPPPPPPAPHPAAAVAKPPPPPPPRPAAPPPHPGCPPGKSATPQGCK